MTTRFYSTILLVWVLICSALPCAGQAAPTPHDPNSYENRYDFNFRSSDRWNTPHMLERNQFNGAMRVRTICYIDHKGEHEYENIDTAYVVQTIPLNLGDRPTPIVVRVDARAVDITGIMECRVIDSNGHISAPAKTPLVRYRFGTSYVELTASGRVELEVKFRICYQIEKMISSRNYDAIAQQSLYLRRLNILVDNESIAELPVTYRETKVDTTRKIELRRLPLGKASVVALAETVHGSQTIQRAWADQILEMVRANECRLVGLEVPINQAMWINAFVDNTPIDTSRIRVFCNSNTLSFDVMRHLIAGIRAHNDTSERKTMVWGFDRCEDLPRVDQSIYEYLKYILPNKDALKDTLLKDFLGAMDENSLWYHAPWPAPKDYFKKLQSYVELNEDRLRQVVGDDHWALIRLTLDNMYDQAFTDSVRSMVYDRREQIIYDNITRLGNILCKADERMVINGHFMHLAKHNTIAIGDSTAGEMLSARLGEGYKVVLYTAGSGELTLKAPADSPLVVSNYELEKSIAGSIEHALRGAQEPLALSSSAFVDGISYVRHSGMYCFDSGNFMVCAPGLQFDWLVYLPVSSPFSSPAPLNKKYTRYQDEDFYMALYDEVKKLISGDLYIPQYDIVSLYDVIRFTWIALVVGGLVVFVARKYKKHQKAKGER